MSGAKANILFDYVQVSRKKTTNRCAFRTIAQQNAHAHLNMTHAVLNFQIAHKLYYPQIVSKLCLFLYIGVQTHIIKQFDVDGDNITQIFVLHQHLQIVTYRQSVLSSNSWLR